MKPNPYTPPTRNVPAPRQVRGQGRSPDTSATPLCWLLGFATLTLLLAWIDARQEGVRDLVFTLQIITGAVLAQIPGVVCGELYRRASNRDRFLFLMPAFIIATISLIIYTICVLAGQLQTVNNAAQMHVILLPCLLYTSPSPRDKRQSRMPSSA